MLFFFVIRNVQTFHFFRHQLHVGILTTTATFPAFSFLKVRDLSHENLNPFIGACIESPNILLVWSYCKKGSLQVCNSFVREFLREFVETSFCVIWWRGNHSTHKGTQDAPRACIYFSLCSVFTFSS